MKMDKKNTINKLIKVVAIYQQNQDNIEEVANKIMRDCYKTLNGEEKGEIFEKTEQETKEMLSIAKNTLQFVYESITKKESYGKEEFIALKKEIFDYQEKNDFLKNNVRAKLFKELEECVDENKECLKKDMNLDMKMEIILLVLRELTTYKGVIKSYTEKIMEKEKESEDELKVIKKLAFQIINAKENIEKKSHMPDVYVTRQIQVIEQFLNNEGIEIIENSWVMEEKDYLKVISRLEDILYNRYYRMELMFKEMKAKNEFEMKNHANEKMTISFMEKRKEKDIQSQKENAELTWVAVMALKEHLEEKIK